MGLTLVATPIGNLGDLSPRAIEVLTNADLWLVEDSRISGKLQSHLGLKKPMRVLNEHTSERQVEAYVRDAAEQNVAVVTDGGCPTVSDPGAHLTDLCLEEGITVDAIPGPSAVIDALMLSGFYGQRFAFLGFLPRKPGPMKAELEVFSDSPLTLVAFESQFRFRNLLMSAHTALGNRRYAICRELTKLHQQVWRGRLPELPDETDVPAKGEFTIVIEGKRRASSASEDD
ncbi:MAG TPA: 16S rRNA (cytidine(1402)-2'-O)-methyltransferase [Fimbriimonadaceae bacterium]|nr:16S rRNA (cytidine(1402)-2'-O)-methyltransferase [Fimbriimonadaceae bacterium]